MSLYGALAYNYEKVAAGTAEILSGNRMISDRLGLPSEDMRLALLSFENYLLANRNTEKPVLHISLSPAPEDRLTDGWQNWRNVICRRWGMGISLTSPTNMPIHTIPISILSVSVWMNRGKRSAMPTSIGVP